MQYDFIPPCATGDASRKGNRADLVHARAV